MTTTSTPAPSAHDTGAPAIPALADFKINGVAPFWSPGDGVDERLSEAHAILTMFADRHQLAEDLYADRPDERGDIREEIKARAIDGVKTLIALALYHSDCADAAKPMEARRG
jgi:hypothetical protein